MSIIATFSNGYTDEYKGKRDVKAAWMVVRKSDGKVLLSGHSLDRARAEKTARSSAAQCGIGALTTYTIGRSHRDMTRAHAKLVASQLAQNGIEVDARSVPAVHNAAKEANARCIEQRLALVDIEVIDL